MSYGIICRQKPDCPNLAAYRFTWPMRDESFICEEHSRQLRGLCQHMGWDVKLTPLTDADHSGAEGMKSLKEQRVE